MQFVTVADAVRPSYSATVARPRPSLPGTPPFPVLLQQRAECARRKHVLRAAGRRISLLVADLAALSALRLGLRALREFGSLGREVQSVVSVLLPKGMLYPYELAAALFVGLTLAGSYRGGDQRRDARRIFEGTLLGVGLITWGRFWVATTADPAHGERALLRMLAFAVVVIVVALTVIADRMILDRFISRLRPLSTSTIRVLAVGPSDACRRVVREYVRCDRACTSVGFLNTDSALDPDALGDTTDLAAVIGATRADAVLLCGDLAVDLVAHVIRFADTAGCRVLAMPRLPSVRGLHVQRATLGGVPVVQLTRPTVRGGQLIVKRAFDVVLATVAMTVLSPLLAALALAVRLTSPGPALYPHTRIGHSGRPFTMYKFRSMTVGADSQRDELAGQNIYSDARLFKVVDDPRITRLGTFLRTSSLDELPQLWNVLRGDMSLVGPRPPLLSESALYEEHQYARFEMRPGVTGPWQASGRNAITNFDDVIRIETDYMEGWTLGRDISIMLRTVPVVLTRAGAL